MCPPSMSLSSSPCLLESMHVCMCVFSVFLCSCISISLSHSVCGVCVRACVCVCRACACMRVRLCVCVLNCVVSNSENVQTVYEISKLMS